MRLSLDGSGGGGGEAEREDCISSEGVVPNDNPLEHQRSTVAEKTIVQIGKKSVCTVIIMNDDR